MNVSREYLTTVEILNGLELSRLLALTDYLAYDLTKRMHREDRMRYLYSAAEDAIVGRFEKSAGSEPNLRPLQTTDGTAFIALNSELGGTAQVGFAQKPLPPPGTWFDLPRWLGHISTLPVSGARTDREFVKATRTVAGKMNQIIGPRGFPDTRVADGRLLIHAVSRHGFAPQFVFDFDGGPYIADRDLFGITGTGAMLSSMACGRVEELARPEVYRYRAERVANLCYMRTFNDMAGVAPGMGKNTLKLWSRFTALEEIKLGLARVQMGPVKGLRPANVLTSSHLDIWVLPTAHQYLSGLGREIASAEFMSQPAVREAEKAAINLTLNQIHELTDAAAGSNGRHRAVLPFEYQTPGLN